MATQNNPLAGNPYGIQSEYLHNYRYYPQQPCYDIQYYPWNVAIDKGWILLCAGMVFSMQIGHALLESGSVRRKNSYVVFYKYLLNIIAGILAFWVLGFALAFGDAYDNFLGGHVYYAGDNWRGCNSVLNENTQYAIFTFMFAVAMLSNAVWNGVVSERITLKAAAINSFIYMFLTWPIVAAWVWGVGWMYYYGVFDFAGSGVVSLTGAASGLAALLIIGPRYNRWNSFEDVYDERISEQEMKGMRSIPVERISGDEGAYNMQSKQSQEVSRQVTFLNMARLRQRAFDEENDNFGIGNLGSLMIGGLFLWVGYIFLQAGSSWGLIKSGLNLWTFSEQAAVATLIGGMGGGLITYFLRTPLMYGFRAPRRLRFEAAGTMRGVIAGIVATGAGAGEYEPWESFVAGLIGGLFYVFLSKLMEAVRLDDPMDNFAIHAGGGMVGIMVESFLNPVEGIIYGNLTGGKMFGLQLMESVVIFVWSFLVTLIVFLILKAVRILRVDLRTEVCGYDYVEYADEIDFTGKNLLVRKIDSSVGKKA